MKKILLGLALSPLLVLASPQNLANISDLKESIALMIDRLDTLEQEMDTFKQDLQSSKKENKQEEGKNKIKEESKTSFKEDFDDKQKNSDSLQVFKKAKDLQQQYIKLVLDITKVSDQGKAIEDEIRDFKHKEMSEKDFNDKIGYFNKRVDGFKNEVDKLTKEFVDTKSRSLDLKKDEGKNKDYSDLEDLHKHFKDYIDVLNNQAKTLKDEIENMKYKDMPQNKPNNKAASYSSKKVDELQNEVDKLKEEFANMRNNDSSKNLQGEKPDKEDNDKNKGNNNQIPNTDLQNQYKDFTAYVNKKIEELENRIISSSSLNSNSSSLSPSSSMQNNKAECNYNCVSKADFSNYKFERVKKEKYLQEQINVLRKQIEELNKHFQEIKSYYEGS